MPRQKREDYAGAKHHVMNRGVRHGAIFFNDAYCLKFLSILESVVERFGIKVCAYVLMSNHYHLMVESVRGNLSEAMRMLSQEYTQFVNRSPGWDGPVFRGRFKNKIVYDDAHWSYLPLYLHMNPVRARMVTHAAQYIWSSHDVYCGEAIAPDWLSPDEVLEGLCGCEGYDEMFRAVQQGREMAPAEFAGILFERGGPNTGKKPRAAKHKTCRTPAAALKEVAELTGVTVTQLKTSTRGRGGNGPRALALWWLVYGAELGVKDAGLRLGMSSTASSKIMAKWKPGESSYSTQQLWDWKNELDTRKAQ